MPKPFAKSAKKHSATCCAPCGSNVCQRILKQRKALLTDYIRESTAIGLAATHPSEFIYDAI